MASEKITAIIDEVKALSVLELKELLPLALLLPLQKRRPSSMLCWLKLAATRWALSRPLRRSPALP